MTLREHLLSLEREHAKGRAARADLTEQQQRVEAQLRAVGETLTRIEGALAFCRTLVEEEVARAAQPAPPGPESEPGIAGSRDPAIPPSGSVAE